MSQAEQAVHDSGNLLFEKAILGFGILDKNLSE